MILQGMLIALSLAGLTAGQDDANPTVSKMDRQSLHEYTLAKCSDGSPAAYYIDTDLSNVAKNVMIYFDNSVDSFKNPIQPCTSVDECLDICESYPEACEAPIDVTRIQNDGVWSREQQNNPFAEYFKIYLPSCSLDDFSGARGPLFGSQGGKIFFHGRHIFSSLLRDLVAKYGIDQAENVVLVGSGSGARGVGHSCDYLAEAIATVNEKASVKCVLDSPDLTPYWLNDEIAQKRCNETGDEAFIDETTKDLWGRTDDESCIRQLENEVSDSTLAASCGMFSQYWKHVKTPMFIIASQWNEVDFNRVTCHVDEEDEDYFTYSTLWRQGVMTMIQVMSLEQPANGWFIPNCQDQTLFFADEAIEQRKSVKIPLFVTGEEQNLLTVINNWLTKDIEDDKYQAIDQFGSPHEVCSAEFQSQRSQPLKKKNRGDKKSAKQRIALGVPLDPLSDVPQPKGFPDGPPPKPSDPIDNLYLDDPFSSDSLLGRNLFGSKPRGSQLRNKNKQKQKANLGLPKANDFSDSIYQGLSDSEIILAGELFKRQKMAAKQRRLRPNVVLTDRDNYDYDFLYYLRQLARQPIRQSGDQTNRQSDSQTNRQSNQDYSSQDYLDSLSYLQAARQAGRQPQRQSDEQTNIQSDRQRNRQSDRDYYSQDSVDPVSLLSYLYRNRFQIPTDLLYYRYNTIRPGRRPLRPTTNTDAIFDPVDPSTPDFIDYDYDVNVNYDRPLNTPTPVGVLPEQAVALANTKSRKARLWRKVYYLQYLRELYRRTYADYYNDYYYGIQGSGNLNGRLTKSDSPKDE